jgi:CDP-Glycerol:Poly(glycerophosphate) glycerophosphotransferase
MSLARFVPARAAGRRTLVHDTIYGAVRRHMVIAARAIDDAVVRTLRSRRRILFEASSPMSYALFRRIHGRLSTDPRLEFWFTARDRSWSPGAIFGAVGITDRIASERRARWDKWDLTINTDFWQMTTHYRQTRRVHLFHGVAGKYDLDAPVDLAPEIALFDCLMFPNPDRLRRYVEAGLVPADGTRAALIGYPKADALVDGSLDRRTICESLGLDATRPVLLYAPTWSPYSSLNIQGERIIDALATAGHQLVVKLHDRSYDLEPRASGGIDWDRRLSEYRSHPLVRVVRQADATPLLFAADLLVTDHSSVGFEFMLLDRPIVVMDSPELLERSRISRDKVGRIRAAADLVRDAAELPDAVETALAEPVRHSQERRATAEALFYQPGTATDRAVDLIYSLLELPAPRLVQSCRLDPLERPAG